jgi:ubiquinone/menaquinone biosynthesis C-methylase UbiE
MNPDEMYANRKAFFNSHAEKWLDMWYKNPGTGRHDLYDKSFERLFSMAPLKEGDRVYDAGCGVGVLVPFIMERIGAAGHLYEVDYAENMIEVNRRAHTLPNIEFIAADVVAAGVEADSCDVVFCFSCFPHFHDKPGALAAMAGAMKPNGTIAIAHFGSSEEISRHHSNCRAVMHDRLPAAAEMQTMCRDAGLVIKSFIDEPGFYALIALKRPA